MSHIIEVDAELAAELVGLPAAVDKALKEHPNPVWEKDGQHVTCAGPDCDWARDRGVNVKRAWHKHQVWAVQMSVREWYING